MTTLSLQSTVLRRLLQQSASKNVLRSGSSWFSAGSVRSMATEATEQEKAFQAKGFLDERRLTVFDTLHEMQVRSCQVFAEKPLFGTYSNESKEFEWMSFGEYDQAVNKCRAVLKDIGVEANSKVAIIANNRWEWATVAAAAYSLNANPVPMYEAQMPSDWTYILNDSGCTSLFCASQDIYDRVHKEVLPNAPSVRSVLCFDAPKGEPHSFKTAMANAVADTEGSLIQAPTPDDLASLIYTSGTTGKPKGVELTHLNFTSNVKSAARSLVADAHDFIRKDDCSLAFLPWAHSYGQTCELWIGVSHGVSMGICRGVPMILEDLQLVKPSMLFAVPTLYKKIYDGVHNLIETSSPLRKRLMKEALVMGRQNLDATNGDRAPLGLVENLKFKALDSIVLAKIRARFGGNLRHGFVAGAACPSEVLTFMDSIGIPVCEGYGLTETSPIIAINTPEQRQIGSIGRPVGGVTVFIMDEHGKEVPEGQEGEICCVGPNVMRGYFNNKEATDEVMSVAPDGRPRMFHTGDLGRRVEDGFIKVTGRLKEQYKLENGKYICPTPIEESIGMSRFVSQVVLCGANRPFNVALLVPEWPAIRICLGVDENVSDEDLANDDRVKELIDAEIISNCVNLKKFEIPQDWAFVAPFTAANDMITPKMSIRRHKVMHVYGDIVSHMYGDDPIVTEAADPKGGKERAGESDQVA